MVIHHITTRSKDKGDHVNFTDRNVHVQSHNYKVQMTKVMFLYRYDYVCTVALLQSSMDKSVLCTDIILYKCYRTTIPYSGKLCEVFAVVKLSGTYVLYDREDIV